MNTATGSGMKLKRTAIAIGKVKKTKEKRRLEGDNLGLEIGNKVNHGVMFQNTKKRNGIKVAVENIF